ncbi:MAG: sulfite exporter TauE/SafE family protein [Egibacteraceae bacterium]
MTPLELALAVFAVSVAAGVLGSLLGVGGGIILVPILTLMLHVDIRVAIGASIISVIATSSGAAAAHVRERITNLRVAMFLEVAATAGALSGAYFTGVIPVRLLYMLFALVIALSAWAMLRKRMPSRSGPAPADALADRLLLHGWYFDRAAGEDVAYRVSGSRISFALMYVAGMMSGLLGVGSGVLKVPAMDLAMRLPIKVSTATSNFMIGVTAAATAGAYFARGQINPLIVGPVAAGMLLGAVGGSRLLGRARSSTIRRIFVALLVWVSFQMLLRGLGPG